LKTITLKSVVLGEERTVLVRTPTGYEADNEKGAGSIQGERRALPKFGERLRQSAEAHERGGRFDLAEPLYDKAHVLGQQNNDPNTARYKAHYERVHAKLKEKQ
jgi:hypothetical protein